MRVDMPLLKRSASKLTLDVLPAALASLVGGMVLGQYHPAPAAAPAAVQAAPASAEMMAVLRDEHTLLADFLKARLAKEKQELAANKTVRDTAAPRAPSAPADVVAPRATVVAAVAAKPGAVHDKAPVAISARAPVVIVPTQTVTPAQTHDVLGVLAADGDWLFARTIGIKDQVVAATRHATSAIEIIPSSIGAIGEHISGEGVSATPFAQSIGSL